MIDRTKNAFDYSDMMEHSKWRQEIPFLQFPPEWQIKILPPFSGAVVRFWVQKEEASVSVYLDCYSILGAVNRPYWEIYPDQEGDNSRFYMDDTEELLLAIKDSIERQLSKSS